MSKKERETWEFERGFEEFFSLRGRRLKRKGKGASFGSEENFFVSALI